MKLDHYDSLGFYALAVLAVAAATGSIFSTSIIKVIGYRACLVIGSFTGSFIQFVSLLPAYRANNLESDAWYYKPIVVYTVVIFAYFLNGIGSSLIWIAEGKYISGCSTPETRGFYFGYFWAYFMLS